MFEPSLPWDLINHTLVRYKGRIYQWNSGEGYTRVTLFAPHGEPAPRGFRRSSKWERIVKQIPTEDIEDMFHISVYCRWRGKKFEVFNIEDGVASVTLNDSDPNGQWAADNGLTVMGPGDIFGSIPANEAEDFHEVRTERLSWWKDELAKQELGYHEHGGR